MFLSVNLLKKYCPFSLSPQELAELLTLHSFEVEGGEEVGASLEKVVVGKVQSVEKHPQADRLHICQVDVGQKILNIVCGAPNVAAGQKVAVALVGARLPHGMKIAKRKVRGVVSEGMICAEDELGLGNNHEGIMVLTEDFPLGKELAPLLDLPDYILEVDNKSLTNRPDLWGHLGVAREISVLTKKPFLYKEEKVTLPPKNGLKLKITEPRYCPTYLGVKIQGLRGNEPSPLKLKALLENLGLNSVNRLVDFTNYLMAEVGNPVHAFDSQKIKGQVEVRFARDKERFLALDQQEYILQSNDLVIADQEKVLALAGIIGGQEASVSENTTEIFLELANFSFKSIRQTASRLHIRTEASMRFEKSLDPLLPFTAWNLGRKLLAELFPQARVVAAVEARPSLKPTKISFSWPEVNKKTGLSLTKKEVKEILTRLGFGWQDKGKEKQEITVPSWRATGDVSQPEDLVEEVARVFGYHNINPDFPEVKIKPFPPLALEKLTKKTRDFFLEQGGLTEVYNYSFVSDDILTKLGLAEQKYLELANPAAQGWGKLRQSLLPNLLEDVANYFKEKKEFFLGEVGEIFLPQPGKEKQKAGEEKTLPEQKRMWAIVYTCPEDKEPFFFLKGLFAGYKEKFFFAEKFKEQPNFEAKKYGYLHTGRREQLFFNQQPIGVLGEISPWARQKLGINQPVACLELDLTALAKFKFSCAPFSSGQRYPAVKRDLAILVDKEIYYKNLIQEIRQASRLLTKVELFDVYEGKNLPKGKKSLAFHLFFCSPDRTLTSEEADKELQKVWQRLEKKFQAQIR